MQAPSWLALRVHPRQVTQPAEDSLGLVQPVGSFRLELLRGRALVLDGLGLAGLGRWRRAGVGELGAEADDVRGGVEGGGCVGSLGE